MPLKVNITERALLARINRALAPRDEVVRKARGERVTQELGQYFAVNGRNHICGADIDLEALGRELGVLRPYEALAND